MKGKYIVITRSEAGSGRWQKYFEDRGARVYYFPTIEIIPAKPTRAMLGTLAHINEFDWVIVTSGEGLRALHSIAKKSNLPISPKHFPPLASLGDETTRAARAMGYTTAFQPSMPNSTALAWELRLAKKSSVLLLRSAIGSPKLRTILTARGATVVDFPLYRTIPILQPDPQFSTLLKENAIECITFASPSAVDGFFKRVDKKIYKKALGITAISIGPNVSKTLRAYGFKSIRTAKEPTAKAMAEAMV